MKTSETSSVINTPAVSSVAFSNNPLQMLKQQNAPALIKPPMVQKKEGDPDDPHKIYESKSKDLDGPAVHEAVLVPNVSGCAAVKINVFRQVEEQPKLIQSTIFHSDGKSESIEEAKQIALRISRLGQNISVHLHIIFNGNWKSSSDHTDVIREITAPLEQKHIAIQKEITHLQLPTQTTISIDVTGSTEDIKERYNHLIADPAESEERIRLFTEYQSLYNRRGQLQMNQKKIRAGRGQKNNPQYIDAITPQEFASILSLDKRRAIIKELNDHIQTHSQGSNCFITTACIRYFHKQDDCEELTILRQFRDDYLLHLPHGSRLIELYYRYSPRIVQNIRGRQDEEEIYKNIYARVLECISAINTENKKLALKIYCETVLRLQRSYLPVLDQYDMILIRQLQVVMPEILIA